MVIFWELVLGFYPWLEKDGNATKATNGGVPQVPVYCKTHLFCFLSTYPVEVNVAFHMDAT